MFGSCEEPNGRTSDGARRTAHGARREDRPVRISGLRGLRSKLFGDNGPRTVAQFASAVLVLAVITYFLKGRDQGMAFWEAIIACVVYGGLAVLLRTVIERHRR